MIFNFSQSLFIRFYYYLCYEIIILLDKMNHKSTRKLLFLLILFISIAANAQERENIKPLISTKWGQGYPFNLLCPKKGGVQILDKRETHMPAGCGPIAMAQMINYYKCPQFSPDHKYKYEYEKSYDEFDEFVLSDQLLFPAKLINDCGVTAFANYQETQTPSKPFDILSSMKRFFKFSLHGYIMLKQFFDNDEWESMIYNELKAGHPVIMMGARKQEGIHKSHMFIVDGYKNGKFHFNFGWAGFQDGYYKLSNPIGFKTSVAAFFNLFPANIAPEYITIETEKPGQITKKMIAGHPYLRVVGPIDTMDIATIRDNKILALDLSHAIIDSLQPKAFFKHKYLTYVALPMGLKQIPKLCFYECVNLSEINLPSSLHIIDSYAFISCQSLLHLNLPEGLTSIGRKAFKDNDNLLHIHVPQSVKYIGVEAFANSNRLYKLEYPSATRMDKDVTKDCPRLKELIKY